MRLAWKLFFNYTAEPQTQIPSSTVYLIYTTYIHTWWVRVNSTSTCFQIALPPPPISPPSPPPLRDSQPRGVVRAFSSSLPDPRSGGVRSGRHRWRSQLGGGRLQRQLYNSQLRERKVTHARTYTVERCYVRLPHTDWSRFLTVDMCIVKTTGADATIHLCVRAAVYVFNCSWKGFVSRTADAVQHCQPSCTCW